MNRMAGGFTIVAGALVVLSAIAPWATSEGPFSQNGLARGDGWIVVGLGLALLGLGALAALGRPGRPVRSATFALAAVGLVLGIAENAKVDSAIAPLSPTVHLGIGIYLLATASLLALVAAWRGRLGNPRAATAR